MTSGSISNGLHPDVDGARMIRMRLQLRRSDLARGAHDNPGPFAHGVYGQLFLEAREAFLAPFRERGVRFVLVHEENDYYLDGVGHAGQSVDVSVAVSEIHDQGFTLVHEMSLRQGTLAARSRASLVAWDVVWGRPRRLDPHERRALESRTHTVTPAQM